MKNSVAIIQFPGSNTERETMMACHRVGIKPVEFLWNRSPVDLSCFDGFIIVGGFSYEDRSRAGIIASLDPIMEQIKEESALGKPILGICNGAQILVECGLVPGSENDILRIALTNNKRIKNGSVVGVGYYNTWTNLKMPVSPGRCAFTRHLNKNNCINIPLAHGQGRFVVPSKLLRKMIKNDQDVFRYCDKNGTIIDEFPTNPNGSVHNLAAVCNLKGNVMAMMPHPERTKNGDPIFSSMKEYMENKNPIASYKLNFKQSFNKYSDYSFKENTASWKISTIITDNVASSVEKKLQSFGCDVTISRQIYWEIETDKEKRETLEKIDRTGELYNSNKEYIDRTKNKADISFLIKQKDDIEGRIKYESLTKRFEIDGLIKINKGIIWNVSVNSGNISDTISHIFKTNILHNPISHECYRIN